MHVADWDSTGCSCYRFYRSGSQRKGVETLIRAMHQVWQMYPSARLLIAGAKTIYADRLATMLAELPFPTGKRSLTL